MPLYCQALPHLSRPLTCSPRPSLWVRHQLQRFLKSTWVWGVCRPPGIVGRLAHVLFMGRRSSAFLHPKGACDPKPVSITFLNGPHPPSPTSLSGGLAAVPLRDDPALVFLSPAALEVAAPRSETCQPPDSTWALDQVRCLAPAGSPGQEGPGPQGAQCSDTQALSPLQASRVKWGDNIPCRVGRGDGRQQAWRGSRTSLELARFPLPGHQGSPEGKARLCGWCTVPLIDCDDPPPTGRCGEGPGGSRTEPWS